MGPISPISSAVQSTPTTPAGAHGSLENLSAAAETLNAANAFGSGNEVVIKVDKTTHKYIVQVVDRDTNQVLQQLAPPKALLMARQFGE